MNLSEPNLEEHLDEARDALHRRERSWKGDLISVDSVPNALYSTAKAYRYLSNTAALLGAVEQAREWSGHAARFYLENIRAARLRRDMRERGVWQGEPQMFSRALNHAVLSRNAALLSEVATEAIEMDESYLDAFEDDYAESHALYYNVKAKAALALADGRAREFVEALGDGIDRMADASQYWMNILLYYEGIIDSSGPTTEEALNGLHEYYVEEDPDPDDPRWYVFHNLCALIVLARRHGIDVSVDSERLPKTLLSDEIPDNDIELEIDLEGLQLRSDVGPFELERDDDGSPVIAGRIYHPGGREVTAEDVPEREAGQVLSDGWVDAALDEATWRDHYDDDLVADAEEAFADGSLTRKLVVVQDQTDEHLFDESLTTLPIDDVELLKGAGRR